MNKLVETALSLTKAQKKRLQSFLNSNEATIAMKLAKNQLMGNDRLMVTQTMANRLAKSKQKGTGVLLKMSKSCMKCNQRGGFLEAILGPITDIIMGDAKRVANSDSEGKRKLNRELEYLRGNGLTSDEQIQGYRDGLAFAKQLEKEGQSGSGVRITDKTRELIGAGKSNKYIDAFLYGLANPFSALELTARRIARAIDKETERKASNGKGMVQTKKVKAPSSPNGGGITFY